MATVVVDGAHTIGFALANAEHDASKAEEKLKGAASARAQRDAVREAIDADLEYMTYVALLSDPAALTRLGVRLDPGTFPVEIPSDPTTGTIDHLFVRAKVKSVEDWRNLLFPPPDHHLVVPDPRDGPRFDAFRAWARFANPALVASVGAMHDTMKNAFNDQIITGT